MTTRRHGPPKIVLSVNVGIRHDIFMKYGQASFHRESILPGRAICGIQIKHIRLIQPEDWYRRCPKCFDTQFSGSAVFDNSDS